jgi:hypothetical protein
LMQPHFVGRVPWGAWTWNTWNGGESDDASLNDLLILDILMIWCSSFLLVVAECESGP